jgi:hypothetical protein
VIPLRPYTYAAAAVALLAAVGTAYTVGRLDGRAHERSTCLSREAQRTAAAERDRAEWRAQIDAFDAARRRAEQEAANAIVQIRTEYLPAKIEVRREVVERAVYRGCAVSARVRDILAAALAGHPMPAAGAVGADRIGVSGDTAGTEG